MKLIEAATVIPIAAAPYLYGGMSALTYIIIGLSAVYIGFLVWERIAVSRARGKLAHVVHVNGIRGKSTVTRLIAAGLSSTGSAVMCKTTGTVPMLLFPDGHEEVIKRRGPANVIEQVHVLMRAAKAGADILVIECMAIDPGLQHICQHDILRADVTVITNVRPDHLEEMGRNGDEICDALLNTAPKGGTLYTADERYYGRMERFCEGIGARAVLADSVENDIDFPDNVGLALAVCEGLGAERKAAMSAMAGFKRDPFALTAWQCGENVFVNAMSANDPASTVIAYERVKSILELPDRLLLVINARNDRPERTKQLAALAKQLSPSGIYTIGQGRRELAKKTGGTAADADCIPLEGGAPATVLAVGNIQGEGILLMERVKRICTQKL